jgi:hypothetical protein
MERISHIVSLPQIYWDEVDKIQEADCTIRSRSDAVIWVFRGVWPELKEKEKQ